MKYLWICEKEKRQDIYAAFRGSFYINEDTELIIRTLGASWYRVWVDGSFLSDGPYRFEKSHPQYEEKRIKLSKGCHVISAQVHNVGLATRMLEDFHPFFGCDVMDKEFPVEIEWKCLQLDAYESMVRRLNPQFGWIEHCDLGELPLNWQLAGYDDSCWALPVVVDPKIEEPKAVTIAKVQNFEHTGILIGSGPLASTFGYERDDIPAVFFLRDLECRKLPAEGMWRRYDLGRVRLFRPSFIIEAPKGTIIEFAYSEQLTSGRVAPYIPLSAGASCNLDHYVCREGKQTISPLTPRGGRFVELHILGDVNKITLHEEKFVERGYYGEADGWFETDDLLLNEIWKVGVETFRACAEDSIIDNPTRERGQWTGDVVSVGMDICSAAYSDYGPLRRGLQQSAWCAREDGLIAGMCPGGLIYLSTYALQWIAACYHYYTLTGDKALLEELYPYAENNINYFRGKWTKEGLTRDIDWCFIDWGYVTNPGPSDMAINIHLYNGVEALIKWCKAVSKDDILNSLLDWELNIKNLIQKYIITCLYEGKRGWEKVGIHRAALSLGEGFYTPDEEKEAVEFIKSHYLNCFPNNLDAPPLGKPSDENPQLITPYFSHYVFPKLIEHGEMDFVLEQYRKCWGWALEDGKTTWVEVFDTRWSHCHQWSGCPTWQLSRYALGLKPRFDIEENCFELNFLPGSLTSAQGKIPNPKGKDAIEVQWTRSNDGINYELIAQNPITIIHEEKLIKVKHNLKLKLAGM
jgi:alpha-L-rhamnosidase